MYALVAVLLFQAAAVAPETRPVVLRVRDAAKTPVKGARLVVEPAVPAEMALAELLAKRAGVSKDDGLLDLGSVPADQPISLRVAAPGYRTGTVKLPAGFEAGRRDVVLVPNQDVEVRVTGLAGRKGEARPEVTLARIRIGKPPQEPLRQILDGEGRARFRRLEGGAYQAELRVPGAGSTRETVEVARDGDLPTLVVDMAVGEWTFRGTTRLHDGTGVPARVTAMEFVNGHGRGTAAEGRSEADGSFEMRVVSKAGNKMLLNAESDDPRAVSNSTAAIPLDAAHPILEDVMVELDATALEILVRDSRSSEPLAGCEAGIDWEKAGESSYRSAQRTTNTDGIVRELALSGGTVRVHVSCTGHYAKDLGVVAVARDETKRLDVPLDPSRDLVLAAVGEGGRPVAGASVFSSEGPLLGYGSSGRQGRFPLAGLTNDAGELVLPGATWGGRPVFVVAPGRSLGIGTVPTPEACDRPDDCRVVVTLAAPRPSGGVVVRSESGEAIDPWDLTIRRGAFPLSWSILTAVLHANGLAPDVTSAPLDLPVVVFLPEGAYSVTRNRRKTDPETKKETWIDVPLGSFAVPSLERVELVDRDGVSPKAGDLSGR